MPSLQARVPGEPDARQYAWPPRLVRSAAILELLVDGQWVRVENTQLEPVRPRSKPEFHDGDFCDASCRG